MIIIARYEWYGGHTDEDDYYSNGFEYIAELKVFPTRHHYLQWKEKNKSGDWREVT